MCVELALYVTLSESISYPPGGGGGMSWPMTTHAPVKRREGPVKET